VSFKLVLPAPQPYVRSNNRDAAVWTLVDGVIKLCPMSSPKLRPTSDINYICSPSPIQMFVDKVRGSSR